MGKIVVTFQFDKTEDGHNLAITTETDNITWPQQLEAAFRLYEETMLDFIDHSLEAGLQRNMVRALVRGTFSLDIDDLLAKTKERLAK